MCRGEGVCPQGDARGNGAVCADRKGDFRGNRTAEPAMVRRDERPPELQGLGCSGVLSTLCHRVAPLVDAQGDSGDLLPFSAMYVERASAFQQIFGTDPLNCCITPWCLETP